MAGWECGWEKWVGTADGNFNARDTVQITSLLAFVVIERLRVIGCEFKTFGMKSFEVFLYAFVCAIPSLILQRMKLLTVIAKLGYGVPIIVNHETFEFATFQNHN